MGPFSGSSGISGERGPDFWEEVDVSAESVCHPFDDFDAVVDSLQGARLEMPTVQAPQASKTPSSSRSRACIGAGTELHLRGPCPTPRKGSGTSADVLKVLLVANVASVERILQLANRFSEFRGFNLRSIDDHKVRFTTGLVSHRMRLNKVRTQFTSNALRRGWSPPQGTRFLPGQLLGTVLRSRRTTR